MPFDFPNSPTNGQTVTGANGVVYRWDGTKWAATGTSAYAPIASPVFTGDARAVTPAPGDNDTSIATSAFVQAAVAPTLNNVGRNLIHNPLFNVAQRGVGVFSTSGYTADRWRLDFSLDTAVVQPTPLGDAQRAAIGDEAATNSLLVNVTGNAGAGAFTVVSQFIEDVRRLSGKTVTVSFWAYATAGAPRIGVAAQQVFGTGGSPSAAVVINGTPSPPLTTAPARYSVTIAYPSTAGKTTGTNNDHYSRLALFFSSGANTNAFAGGIGVQTAVFLLWGVQLEIGAIATPLEKPDPQQDLAKCQRFYQVVNPIYLSATGTVGVVFGSSVYLSTAMRGAPTVAATGAPGLANCTGLTFTQAGSGGFVFYATTTATGATTINAGCVASADL